MGQGLSTILIFLKNIRFLKSHDNDEPEFSNASSTSSFESLPVNESFDKVNEYSTIESNTLQDPLTQVHNGIEPNSSATGPVKVSFHEHHTPSAPKRPSRPEMKVHQPINSSSSLQVHEFVWKYSGKQVFLAGTFNNWNPSIELLPTDQAKEYFRAQVLLDPKQPWEFKFVVDGIWRCSLDIETVSDLNGNLNNIIRPQIVPK